MLLLAVFFEEGGAVASTARSRMQMTINPIRRVVTLLQGIQKKVTAEKERDEEIFEKFSCYCKSGTGELEKAISHAEMKLPLDTSSIAEEKAAKEQLEADIQNFKDDLAQAEKEVAQARQIREKESKNSGKELEEQLSNLNAVNNAVTALKKGMGNFLQSAAADALRRLTINLDLSTGNRDIMSSFLVEDQDNEYEPKSGEILGILQQIKDDLEKAISEAKESDKNSKQSSESLIIAKQKQIAVSQKTIEEKLVLLGESGVQIQRLQDDIDDTSKALRENRKFFEHLQSDCSEHTKKFQEVEDTRAAELQAVADTIKVLNDDDALDLFKKTLPSPALLQVKVSAKMMRLQALRALKAARARKGIKDVRLGLLTLLIHNNKMGFDKVTAMIDKMVKLLDTESRDDDKKKQFCVSEFEKTEDKQQLQALDLGDISKAMATLKSTIESIKDEIAILANGIQELDEQVVAATATRKEEHTSFQKTLAASKASSDLLALAKNRLYKFYSPKLFKEAPQKVSEEDRIYSSMGGTVTTPEPGGIANTGISSDGDEDPSFLQVTLHMSTKLDQPPPPEDVAIVYAKKSESANGVVDLLDILSKDLQKEMIQLEAEEKSAQDDYETYIEDCSDKRTADLKSVSSKESAKADCEADLNKLVKNKKLKQGEIVATKKYMNDLHNQCDWLMKNFDTRRDAREDERDSLTNAKSILSGAEYSLVQTAHAHMRAIRK